MSGILEANARNGFEIPVKEVKMEVKEQSSLTMEQQKIKIEFKLSKNFNSVTLGIEDQPIVFEGEEQQRQEIRKMCKVLREEVEYQLSLIGTKENQGGGLK